MKYELINVMNGKVVAIVKTKNEALMIQAIAKETVFIKEI